MSNAGPPQGAKAPLGGSDLHAVNERGGLTFAPRTRVQRRPVHGVLLLDKPLGLSSNDALQKAKWLLRAEKAGHTGTLDPLATGVLPLCFGAATKFSQMHLDAHKTYEAVLRLGQRTTTADAEGEVIAERPVAYTAQRLAEVVRQFTGVIRQVPPMHSALKKDGRALYEYARAGIEVERTAREVEIFKLEVLDPSVDGSHSAIKIRVSCSKGTYIRTLGEDIGEALGCGAHLASLRRVATGPFGLERCVTLAALEAMDEAQRDRCLLPVEALLADHTPLALEAADVARFLNGVCWCGAWPDQARVAVYGPEGQSLLGTAQVVAGELIPTRLLSPIEIDQIVKSSPQALCAA